MFARHFQSHASLYALSTSLLRSSEGVLAEILTPAELALFNDMGLEKPPTDEELSLLRPGYEQRILSAVLARLDAGFAPRDAAGVDDSAQAC